MRHTLLLVAALGLIAVIGPSALAQDQDKTSSEPATPPPSESAAPAALPTTYTQPAMPGQVVSPYAPAYTGMVTPCGSIMPSAHIPGTVMYGSQYPQYQPMTTHGTMRTMIPPTPYGVVHYGQPGIQYTQPMTQNGQPTVMPVAGSVVGGVMAQPSQTGAMYTNGMTFQPVQPGVVYTNGMTYQPGTVFQAGTLGAYSGQPVMLTGYTNGFVDSNMTTRSARRGLFGRLRR